MSNIRTAIEKLDDIISSLQENNSFHRAIFIERVKKVKELLSAKTVFFIEWNEIDFQCRAKGIIAQFKGVPVEDVKENPLSREQLISVVEILEQKYDANIGIGYEDLTWAIEAVVNTI